ncbi:MAG: hypothetical protein ACRD2G_05935, partial [Terriglobia bacterium]
GTTLRRPGSRWPLIVLFLMSVTVWLAGSVRANASTQAADFYYAGGTETISTGCGGELELTKVSMTFKCADGSVTIPYSSITLMQYRPKLSSQVRKMKLNWKARPEGTSAKKNLLFTVLYRQGSTTQAMVLKVHPDNMRPYLAAIELNTRMRIQVWDYRGYD